MSPIRDAASLIWPLGAPGGARSGKKARSPLADGGSTGQETEVERTERRPVQGSTRLARLGGVAAMLRLEKPEGGVPKGG